jgi:hypothetical protein
VRKLSNRSNKFIVVWPGDKPEAISYDGSVFLLPPRDEIASPRTRGSRYRLASAVDRATETAIPGTIVVEDVFRTIEGRSVKTFDARDFVEYVENHCEHLLDRGMAIAEYPEEVAEFMKRGIPIFDASNDRKARRILEGELSRQKKLTDQGRPITAASNEKDVVWAHEHLRRRNVSSAPALSSEAIHATLSGVAGAAPPPPRVSQRQEPEPPPAVATDAERAAGEGSRLFDQATGLRLKLSRLQIVGLFKGEREVVNEVKRLIRAADDSRPAMRELKELERPAAE